MACTSCSVWTDASAAAGQYRHMVAWNLRLPRAVGQPVKTTKAEVVDAAAACTLSRHCDVSSTPGISKRPYRRKRYRSEKTTTTTTTWVGAKAKSNILSSERTCPEVNMYNNDFSLFTGPQTNVENKY
ncbi:hypothetical protein RRG08_034916 [Elysia crispata]|uniref:Uncharacterized protein n=1 Tax=Elysia crispata TaxID=231223 RepID=A0AAE0YPM1_9GAST|nr:hypothetical protein RRG08_034916 [Elysia crispata]